MNLYDIRTAVARIAVINKGLTKERLSTLLEASGWDKRDREDALMLWESGDIGTEESKPTTETISLVPEVRPSQELQVEPVSFALTEKEEEVTLSGDTTTETFKDKSVELLSPYKKEEYLLPNNLPLRPYETSHVTVPLAEYEKNFVETEPVVKEETIIVPPTTPSPAPLPQTNQDKIPFEGEDFYLLGVTMVLFLFLMLLLGYMYTNGRL